MELELKSGVRRGRRKKKPTEDNWQKDWKCTQQELLVFTRQLATLLHSGVALLPSLEALGESELGNLTAVTDDVAARVANGWGLAKALACFPKIFSRVYIGMIRVAEQTGAMVTALDNLSTWLESDQAVMRKAKSVMTYPLIVLAVTLLLTLGLFLHVMPGFVRIFQQMEVELPLITRILIVITEVLTSGWGWLGIVVALVIFLRLGVPLIRSPKGQRKIFAFLLMTPVIGPTLESLTIGRFCSAAALMIPSGASLLSVVKLAAVASGSPVLVADTKHMLKALTEGSYLAEYMELKPNIYPTTLAQVVTVGENTSTLDFILGKFAELYKEDVDHRLDNLASVMEPLLLTGAAVVVGVVLAGVFLPLYGFLGKL